MRIGFNILLLLVLVSCSMKRNTSKDCTESKIFKDKFFIAVQRVEGYVLGKGDKKLFQSSLKFISKYTHVSYDKMLNYNNSYTKIEDYEEDKKNG